jgi:hypothetical protein
MKTNQLSYDDFKEFLESIGGLKNGFFTDREPITDPYYFEINSGWHRLVKDLISDLIELGWDKEICQVKEKFGTLRFYINGGSDEIHNRIHQAELDSSHICERCGSPGELIKNGGWLSTLCAEHNKPNI